MSKLKNISRRSYIFIILALFYIPLLFAAVFSFNADPRRGGMNFKAFSSFSTDGWSALTSGPVAEAITNSFLLAIPTAIITIMISLLTVYGLWRQKSKVYKMAVDGTSAIPLINPDIITAVGLALTFGILFGQLQFGQSGYVRTVIAHVTMILPFIITVMYPRSTKFQASLMEASKDLGFGPIRTWLKTYLIYMIPVIAGSLVIALVLSLDDFIVTRIIYRQPTIGKMLYGGMSGGSVKAWSLAIGTSMLGLMFVAGAGYSLFKIASKKIRILK